MPPSVRYTEPRIPEPASDASGTAKAIDAYEKANQRNKFAIEQAKKHNRSLQNTYNKKKAEKKDKNSSPIFGSLFKF